MFDCKLISREIEYLCLDIIIKSIKNNISLNTLYDSLIINLENDKINLFNLCENFQK